MALLLLVLMCCSYCSSIVGASKLPIEFGFDSIYQFGDSISDTGNLMTESPWMFCSRTPYGETYFHKPTGRCSDGLLIVDYFAKAFNLPLLNPYLQRDANFTHGVNFAVAGATALNASKYPKSSLSVQLEWFRAYVDSACSSPSDCKRKFKNALFLVGEVGGNDYNYVLVDAKSIPDAYNLVPDVIRSIKHAVEEVIDHGAIHVVVPGNFPIGCMPIFIRAFKSNNSKVYDNLGCVKSLNQFAKFHNRNLKQAIKDLQKQHPSVQIHYGDYYSGSSWILSNAASLGFDKDKLFEPCCGNKTHPCGARDAPVCEDPKKRMSWDGTHPTHEAYKNLAEWLLSNTFNQITPSPSPSLLPPPKASGAYDVELVLLRVVAASVLALWAILI